jgi:hypothetical protein
MCIYVISRKKLHNIFIERCLILVGTSGSMMLSLSNM